MRFLLLYIILIISLSQKLNAQINLVPNPSFELNDSCPKYLSEIDPTCRYWFTPINEMISLPNPPYSIGGWGTSDYYNKCAINSDVCIPFNVLGFQNSRTGQAYCGISLILNNSILFNNFKEYVEVKLKKSLSYNKEYCLEFYYSVAELYSNIQDYYPIALEAIATDTLVYRLSGINTQQPQNIYSVAQVSVKLPQIIDTLNWIKVSGSFIAKGGEQYLTIGNFQHTDSLKDKSVYVYIDDVKLYYCGPDTTPQAADSLIVPNVFTPNGDGYNDIFKYKNQAQWEFETQVLNRWGELVYHNKTSQNWDGSYQGQRVSAGVYFYILNAKALKTGEIRVFRGTVTVMY